MTWFLAIVFGAVEGLTEFLPISSTAHLILTGWVFGLPATEFLKTFEIAIQLGAILAVVWFYRERLLVSRALWRRVGAAFIPTALIGFLLYKIVKDYLLESGLVLAMALILGGVILIYFERWLTSPTTEFKTEQLSYRKSFLVGLAQALAIVPGVSRAGATIVAARFAGLSREASVEFSFLLAVPTIAAATGYELWKSDLAFSAGERDLLLVGFVASFVFALLAVRWLLRYVATHDFKWFGFYRIGLGLILLLWFWF